MFYKPLVFQRGIKVRSTPCVLAHFQRIFPVSLVKLSGWGLEHRIIRNVAAFGQKLGKPVVLLPVFADGVPDSLRLADLESAVDDFLCPFDDLGKHSGTGFLLKLVPIILGVRLSFELCPEGDDDQPPPDAVICSPYPWQVVRVQNHSVGRCK